MRSCLEQPRDALKGLLPEYRVEDTGEECLEGTSESTGSSHLCSASVGERCQTDIPESSVWLFQNRHSSSSVSSTPLPRQPAATGGTISRGQEAIKSPYSCSSEHCPGSQLMLTGPGRRPLTQCVCTSERPPPASVLSKGEGRLGLGLRHKTGSQETPKCRSQIYHSLTL